MLLELEELRGDLRPRGLIKYGGNGGAGRAPDMYGPGPCGGPLPWLGPFCENPPLGPAPELTKEPSSGPYGLPCSSALIYGCLGSILGGIGERRDPMLPIIGLLPPP